MSLRSGCCHLISLALPRYVKGSAEHESIPALWESLYLKAAFSVRLNSSHVSSLIPSARGEKIAGGFLNFWFLSPFQTVKISYWFGRRWQCLSCCCSEASAGNQRKERREREKGWKNRQINCSKEVLIKWGLGLYCDKYTSSVCWVSKVSCGMWAYVDL